MEIRLCMGSSCFARGNAQLLDFLELYAEKNKHALNLDLCGCLCQERCGEGPNLFLDGVLHSHMTLSKLKNLLGETEDAKDNSQDGAA